MSKAVKKTDKSEYAFRWTEIYKDIDVLRERPIPEIFIRRFADDLIAWVKSNPKAVKPTQFLEERDIPRATYDWWKKHYPTIKKADDFARMVISNRRELNAITRDWSETASFKMMHRYDPEWQEELDLKKAHELALKTPPAPEVDKERYEYHAYKDATGEVQLVRSDGTITKAKHVDD